MQRSVLLDLLRHPSGQLVSEEYSAPPAFPQVPERGPAHLCTVNESTMPPAVQLDLL